MCILVLIQRAIDGFFYARGALCIRVDNIHVQVELDTHLHSPINSTHNKYIVIISKYAKVYDYSLYFIDEVAEILPRNILNGFQTTSNSTNLIIDNIFTTDKRISQNT